MRYIIALVFAALLIPQASWAAAYKWVDADGQVHFSQLPPPDNPDYETIEAPVTAGQFEEQAEKEADDEAVADNEGEAEKKPLTAKEIRQKNCQEAQARLATLENNQRIAMTGEDGKTKVLTDVERQAEIERTKADTSSYCTELENEEQ